MDAKFTPAFLTVKLIDIGYVTVIYFVLGLFAAKAFDKVYDEFDPEAYKDAPFWGLIGSIILHIFALGIVAYALRNIVEYIPYPLDGVVGFRHNRLKELEGGVVLGVILILFQNNLIEKVKFFAKKYLGIVESRQTDEVIEVKLTPSR